METAPTAALPFYSNQPDPAGASIYHSHPMCRVAQSIAPEFRIPGTGEGRQQCPFCFLLGEFQTNRELRMRQLAPVERKPATGRAPDGGAATPKAQSLRQMQAHTGVPAFHKRY